MNLGQSFEEFRKVNSDIKMIVIKIKVDLLLEHKCVLGVSVMSCHERAERADIYH